MTGIREYIQKHPERAAFVFALFAAVGAYQAFRGGMAAQRIRTATDFLTSEGLGG